MKASSRGRPRMSKGEGKGKTKGGRCGKTKGARTKGEGRHCTRGLLNILLLLLLQREIAGRS